MFPSYTGKCLQVEGEDSFSSMTSWTENVFWYERGVSTIQNLDFFLKERLAGRFPFQTILRAAMTGNGNLRKQLLATGGRFKGGTRTAPFTEAFSLLRNGGLQRQPSSEIVKE